MKRKRTPWRALPVLVAVAACGCGVGPLPVDVARGAATATAETETVTVVAVENGTGATDGGTAPADGGGGQCPGIDAIASACPTGRITYTPAPGYDPNQGRFICGDFAELARACLAQQLPGLTTQFVTLRCQNADGSFAPGGHAIFSYQNMCTGETCLVEPQSLGTTNQQCCMTWLDMLIGGPSAQRCLGPGGFTSRTCGAGQTGVLSNVYNEPNHCEYRQGSYTCCTDTMCAICAETNGQIDPYACASAGAQRCNDTGVLTCQNNNGVLQWTQTTCPSGQRCYDDGSPNLACAPTACPTDTTSTTCSVANRGAMCTDAEGYSQGITCCATASGGLAWRVGSCPVTKTADGGVR